MPDFFSNPILNSPYDYPRRHWETDADTLSHPFPRPGSNKIAVRGINHFVNEVMKV